MSARPPESSDQNSEQYERQHVHEVYEQIAPHFSATRHKPWPLVERFIQEQRAGSIGMDVGCGNGKYLGVNGEVFIVGSDRSSKLVGFAAGRSQSDVVVADALELPHPTGVFDFALSIAVVHHMSTAERRVAGIAAVLETLAPKGRALIYVWALEQGGSRRGWSAGDAQDVMVPWVMRGLNGKKKKREGEGEENSGEDPVFHRYYHLYREGELKRDVEAAGGVVLEVVYEKDNWCAVAMRRPAEGS